MIIVILENTDSKDELDERQIRLAYTYRESTPTKTIETHIRIETSVYQYRLHQFRDISI